MEASSELQWAAVFAKNYEDEEGNSLAINGKKVFLLAGLAIQTSDEPDAELNGLRNPIYNKTTIRNYNLFEII